jgi:hypothetical protein
MGEQVRLAVGRWRDVWRDGMGGDGEVGRDVVSRREGEEKGGEGKTGPTGGARRGGDGEVRVARRERGVPAGGGVPDGGEGGC